MNRQTIIVAALVGVLVLVAYWFFLFSPKNDEIAELEDEIDTVVAQQDTTETQIERLEGVRERAPEIEAAIAAANSVIPVDPALPASLRQLQLAADGAGVRLSTIAPGRPSGESLAMSLSLSIEGGYFQIIDFLRRIEDPRITPRGILWDSVSLSPTDYPTLTASLSGQMFTQSASAEPAPPGGGEAEPEAEPEADEADEEEAA